MEPFVVFSPVNISPDRAIIELFGQPALNRGDIRVVGALERAHLGTLCIDGITNMSMEMQHMLLRFLQDQTVAKPGQNRLTKLDVRIISTSSSDVEQAIEKGKFLKDLYYRLNVMPVRIAPLCERREDIPALCEYYLRTLAERSSVLMKSIAEDAMMVLQAYAWPGNIRQLRNLMEWLLIMLPEHQQRITTDLLPSDISSHHQTVKSGEIVPDLMAMPLREAREVFERQYLLAQMQRFGHNISKTSAFVGMERSALHRKLISLAIHASDLPVSASEEARVSMYQEEVLDV
jgi:two-component system nitrogen regulation response regulator NtrX